MSLLFLALATILLAYTASKNQFDKTYIEIARWVVVALGWWSLGEGIVNGIIAFLVSIALYIPAHNYFTGKDIWFIDNDTTLGKLIIKYLGEGSGRVWFFIQLGTAAVLILIKLLF